MPLKENEPKNIDYKGRLERKLWLARENPEPIFDLSECNLKVVPNNIYSLCKVFRKDALYLQKNKLSSLNGGGTLEELALLTILDISSNSFTTLPNNINALINLKILNISMNKIIEIPETIGDLKNLLHLDASNNQLKNLPRSIGECTSLEYLNIQENKKLTHLPTSLGKLHCLNELLIDKEIIYPLPEICKDGIQAILTFLAKECGEDCNSSKADPKIEGKCAKQLPQSDSYLALQEKVMLLEKLKEQKQKELLTLEQMIINENRREVEMQQLLKDKKKELITVLQNQQRALEEGISKVQENKETQRALLIKECNNTEEIVNLKIQNILMYNSALREALAKTTENERKKEEEILLKQQQKNAAVTKPMEKAALLESMNQLLTEEMKVAANSSSDKRLRVMRTLVSEDQHRYERLMEYMRKFGKNQKELIETISRDEELQKSAVTSLLERSDARLWQIRNQVALVETQLAVLTQVELARRRLQADAHLVELSESRLVLTELLMELFNEQSRRRQELVDSLRRMERDRGRNPSNFWLRQYESLHSQSHELVERLKNIDPEFANELFLHGVFYYIPVLGDITSLSIEELEGITSQDLKSIGINSEDDQTKILKAIQSYADNRRITPSAPPDVEASAPPLSRSPSVVEFADAMKGNGECVICMDEKADVVYVPCGHVCCCPACSASITICPLCRSSINCILQANPRP